FPSMGREDLQHEEKTKALFEWLECVEQCRDNRILKFPLIIFYFFVGFRIIPFVTDWSLAGGCG
ncbi:hypothetical protein NP173_24160, partial [Salmonella enterica]|nr:hypothetical protein [Salmonella enterica]